VVSFKKIASKTQRAAWRDLPPAYGNWKSVYNRYNNWSKKGYITAILAELKKRWRSRMAHA
jgi:transposase